jgi:hypothetical protein
MFVNIHLKTFHNVDIKSLPITPAKGILVNHFHIVVFDVLFIHLILYLNEKQSYNLYVLQTVSDLKEVYMKKIFLYNKPKRSFKTEQCG